MSHIKKELHIFFNALVFFTRIPAPKWVLHSQEFLNLSGKYFPLIGLIVGAIAAAIYYCANLFLPHPVALLLSLISSIVITGAFHEDGFADCCDGFGGGWDKQQILTIMKDSRLGTYGTLGLILILSLKYSALLYATDSLVLLIITGHSLSRFMPLLLIYRYQYVQDLNTRKAKPLAQEISVYSLFFAFMLSLAPILIFTQYRWLLAFIPMLLCTLLLGRYFKKHIHGYTGDCLGAVQQVSEVIYYLTSLLICTSI